MQTCTICNASSPDDAITCVNCKNDLSNFSTTNVALKRMQENPRIRSIRISVDHDACPYCYELMKTYPKDNVPPLPHEGCSHENGCRCFYEPVLDDTAVVGKVVQ